MSHEKTRIENLVSRFSEHGMRVEIFLKHDLADVMVYNKDDLYLKKFTSFTISEAMGEAVDYYMNKNGINQ